MPFLSRNLSVNSKELFSKLAPSFHTLSAKNKLSCDYGTIINITNKISQRNTIIFSQCVQGSDIVRIELHDTVIDLQLIRNGMN